MPEKNEQLEKVKLPKDGWAALTDDEQFAIAILGHIYNEVMILQRLAIACHPYSGQTPVERSGSVCQSALLQRLLAGKIYEAYKRLNESPEIAGFLKEHCFQNMKEGEGSALLKEFKRAVRSTKWLMAVRNQHSMHFPEKAHWSEALSELRTARSSFDTVIGTKAGDVLYETADQIANISFFSKAGDGDWRAGIEKTYDDIKALSSKFNDLVMLSLNAFYESRADKATPPAKRVRRKTAKSFVTPHLADFKIPYFFDLRRRPRF